MENGNWKVGDGVYNVKAVIARSKATKQSRLSSKTDEIAALPLVARNDNLFLIGSSLFPLPKR
jgi:hypothetical protein